MAIVNINEKYRVKADSMNHTLESKNIVQDKETGEKKEKWIAKGYYSSFESVFKALWKAELIKKIDNEECDLKEFLKIAKEVKEELHSLLKDFL